MRKAPPAPEFPSSPTRLVELELEYEFLTFVFGGGVRAEGPKKPFDPTTPIRSASIRGQLRFWWRATNPTGATSVAELRNHEAKLFGGVHGEPQRSQIEIRVRQPSAPRAVRVLEGRFKAAPGFESISYGAFPLRDTDGEDHGTLHDFHKGGFGVALRFPERFRQQVLAAVWAFSWLGGYGGRTRRGFGALRLTKSNIPIPSLQEGWTELVRGTPVDWPHLPKEVSFKIGSKRYGQGLAAHSALLEAMKKLRQGALGRNPGQAPNRPGRSKWPEPDTIRRLTKTHDPSHPPLVAIDGFPRAAFGLPIIFKFKDDRTGDPEAQTANPVGKNRFASPLLIRPIQFAPGDIRGLAVRLSGKRPKRIELSPCGKKEAINLVETEAGRIEPMMKNGRVFVDVIERYLEEIE
ncbi:MAG: type III-B CRISPR module RAMP protein Cmr1 [Deltaproteobacteria bacterium]|nr:type III-B CRISPR module RAMP protein Cmr1 [Deltaproteobacteria bacterium]